MRKAIGAMRIIGLAAVALILVGAIWFAGYTIQPRESTETSSWNPYENLTFSNVNYTDNGLTCQIPAHYLNFPSIIRLVPWVTKTPGFLWLTGGAPYVIGNVENTSWGSGSVGTRTFVTPPQVEMVFYTDGGGTTCKTPWSGPTGTWEPIVVDVPVLNNQLNLTGATCTSFLQPPYWCSGQPEQIPSD